MNNKYGEHPKKKICIVKDHENNQQNQEDKDNENNEDNQYNEDHEQIEYNQENEYNEDNEDNKHIGDNGDNQYNEDNEDYDDNITDKYDLSAPRYYYDKDGNASIFQLGENAKYLTNPDHFWNIMNEYHSLPKRFKHTDKNYLVKKLNAQIDFKEIQINDIQELKINRFSFNNLIDIYLSLFIDQQFETQAIKFIQSILNLQTLKKFFLLIVPAFYIEEEEYVGKIQKQLEFKNYINSQSIFVYYCRRGHYGFNIFSDEGRINKLFFYSFTEINLDIQQQESVEILEIDSECYCLSQCSLNKFLKKLRNLKNLKFNFSSFYGLQQKSEQMELLQTICELEQIKKLELDCGSLSSDDIDCLTITLEETMMPIQSPNLTQLNIYFSQIGKRLYINQLMKQLSTMQNLKILNMSITLKESNDVFDESNDDDLELETTVYQKLMKKFKKLLKLKVKVIFS